MELKNKFAPHAAKELENDMLYKIQEIFPYRLKDSGENFNFISTLLSGNILLVTLQKGLASTIKTLENNEIMNTNEILNELNSGNSEKIWNNFANSSKYSELSNKMFEILIRSVINESILPFIMNYKINKILNGIRISIDFIFNTKNSPTNIPNYPTNTPNYPTNTPNYPTQVPQYNEQIENYIKNIISQIKNDIFRDLADYSENLGLMVTKLEKKNLKTFLYDYSENPIQTLQNLNKYQINLEWQTIWDKILKVLYNIIDSNLQDIKNNYGFNDNIINQSKTLINNYFV